MARTCALLASSALAGICAALGCSRPSLPDPKAAALAYTKAAERGDADALYAMLTESSRRTYGRAGARAVVRDCRAELARKGRDVAAPNARVVARAELRFADGEIAELAVEDGRFRVASAGAFPSGARTPVQALDELRQALARRSYASLLRVLSGEKRTTLENDLRSLTSGLTEPETLDIKVNGDTAEVLLPGGHQVKLKREASVWKVEDFD